MEDIDLEEYHLESKNIIPLDEYLGTDKLPFKVSIRAMIEIAYWGHQSSFKRASEVMERVHNIKISPTQVQKITKYIGKIVYDYKYKKALEVWDDRANLSMDIGVKKGILYMECDGAAVNTRIEYKDGSTWKENKLGILFKNSDIYKRKDSANTIMHKEFVSFVGNVDTFRILVFAKAVELEYWKYEKIIFISDGATWLRNMVNELFPDAIFKRIRRR